MVAHVSEQYVAALRAADSPLIATAADEDARRQAVASVITDVMNSLDPSASPSGRSSTSASVLERLSAANQTLTASIEATRILFPMIIDALSESGYDAKAVASALLERFLKDAGDALTFVCSYAAAHGIVAPSVDYSRLEAPLTARERAVFELLVLRRSAAEISHELGIRVETVKTHTSHITRKLGVHGVRAATAKAMEVGALSVTSIAGLSSMADMFATFATTI